MLRTFIRDAREWGVDIAWANFRFNLGYRIGGFKHASMTPREEHPTFGFWTETSTSASGTTKFKLK